MYLLFFFSLKRLKEANRKSSTYFIPDFEQSDNACYPQKINRHAYNINRFNFIFASRKRQLSNIIYEYV